MSEEVNEECGLAAVSLAQAPRDSKATAAALLYELLLYQQHRGQLSAGITTFNANQPKLLDTYRDMGTVVQAFRSFDENKQKKILDRLNGQRGIGHVRYATFGKDNRSYAQPFERKHGRRWKWFSFGFNGNITNYWEIRKELEEKHFYFSLESDTEVLMHLLAFGSRGEERVPVTTAFESAVNRIDGAYSITFVNALGEIAAVRDPQGFKPLHLGQKDNDVAIASETHALEAIGFEKIKTVLPGQMVHITENGQLETRQLAKSPHKSHCMFEWVYFSHPVSSIENQNVYQARYRLGIELAKHEPLEWDADTIVVPVPDSSKPAADGYAYQLGLSVKEGLLKNSAAHRTFIETRNRVQKVKQKFSLNKPIIENKKVVLVEDSVVRGTTAKALVQLLREKGNAAQVHVRSSCPPVFFPCFYGIDMSTLEELIAARNRKEIVFGKQTVTPQEEEKIAEEIGADSVHYQTMDGLVKSIGLPSTELCTGCLTGKYPTPKGNELIQIATKSHQTGIRIYERNRAEYP